jgi:hypothetical protein
MEKLYRIEEFGTTGWELIEHDACKLTKIQTTQKLESFLGQGYSPERIRAVSDD